MKKIRNPYANLSGYNCFGCSPDNDRGLKMNFFEDGEFICCEWQPDESFQGYFNVLHGGIQMTLMDEIASWVVQVKLKTAGVTSRMDTRFIKTVLIETGPVYLKARLVSTKKMFAEIEVSLYNNNKELCASSMVTYYTVSDAKAREKFFYPGIEHFYHQNVD